jgi:hypothetical protein
VVVVFPRVVVAVAEPVPVAVVVAVVVMVAVVVGMAVMAVMVVPVVVGMAVLAVGAVVGMAVTVTTVTMTTPAVTMTAVATPAVAAVTGLHWADGRERQGQGADADAQKKPTHECSLGCDALDVTIRCWALSPVPFNPGHPHIARNPSGVTGILSDFFLPGPQETTVGRFRCAHALRKEAPQTQRIREHAGPGRRSNPGRGAAP